MVCGCGGVGGVRMWKYFPGDNGAEREGDFYGNEREAYKI
jgi:hypothetical protein